MRWAESKKCGKHAFQGHSQTIIISIIIIIIAVASGDKAQWSV